eukprot:20419-Amphidinium_carterae.1
MVISSSTICAIGETKTGPAEISAFRTSTIGPYQYAWSSELAELPNRTCYYGDTLFTETTNGYCIFIEILLLLPQQLLANH